MKYASVLMVALLMQQQAPSFQEQNDQYEARLRKQIEGRENEPAEEVFENIEILRGVPAGRLLRIMNLGYSRALGVTCTHCQVEGNFPTDEKRPKRAAREMALMQRAINQQLAAMEDLEADPSNRSINCNTCHRGRVSPLAQ